MMLYRRFLARSVAVAAGLAMLAGCTGHGEKAAAKPTIILVGKPVTAYASPELPPSADPELVALTISKDRFGSGDTITGQAVTSTNVASVVVRVEGYALAMKRDGFGRFSMKYTLPTLPSFVKRDYQLTVTASNSAGASVEAGLPIHVR